MYDAIVIGGGPAGLSAAQQLARGCAPTALLDAGVPRNAPADHVNGYLGLDHVPPWVFRERAHVDLERYPHVELADTWADRVTPLDDGGFEVGAGDRTWRGRRVLLTTDATSMAQAAQLAAFEGALAARRIILDLAFEAFER